MPFKTSASVLDQSHAAGSATRRPRLRTVMFWAVLVLVSLSPVVAGELLLRYAGARIADDPYLNFGQVDSYFAKKEIGGQPYYQVANREVYRERNIIFPLRKAANTFRIFCLGGSASAGWPHPQEEIYSRYLQNALQETYPQRTIEVINLSAHAFAAYRVRLIFQEIIEYEPDLIVIYSGNNEFVEKRVYRETPSWLKPVAEAVHRLYLVRRVKGSSLGRRLSPENTLLAEQRQHVGYEQWSKIEQLALDLRKDPEQFRQVKEHYQFSIRSMVAAAQQRQVPVVLVTVPVNLRHWRPNVSYQPLQGEALQSWEGVYRDGQRLLHLGKAEDAAQALQKAIQLAPIHANTHFLLGKALETAGHHEAALNAYSRARDLDHNPFRAPSEFNRILTQMAGQYDNASLADADQAFHAASSPFAPGFELFLDYVHPTKQGNLLVAQSVYDEIVKRRLIGDSPSGGKGMDIAGLIRAQGSSYDEQRDYAMQGVMVRLFVMMHQYESAVQKARLLEQAPGALDSLRDEKDVKLIKGILAVFPDVIERDRKAVLGRAADESEQQRVEVRVRNFYRDNFGRYEEFRNITKT